jgi:hypothetical protein
MEYATVDVAAKKLYELSATCAPWPAWETLTSEEKAPYRKRARVVAASSPAPIVLEVRQVLQRPRVGLKLEIFADVTEESLEEAVQEFRKFIQARAKEWRGAHEEKL